jgi:hypothetical protein
MVVMLDWNQSGPIRPIGYGLVGRKLQRNKKSGRMVPA